MAASPLISATSVAARAVGGLWRWRELLPVQSWEFVVHMGEGSTPLAPAQRLGPKLGLSNLLFKQESLNPTGSFKARGMAVAVSRAVELEAWAVIAGRYHGNAPLRHGRVGIEPACLFAFLFVPLILFRIFSKKKKAGMTGTWKKEDPWNLP